jgi:hypothetical protein
MNKNWIYSEIFFKKILLLSKVFMILFFICLMIFYFTYVIIFENYNFISFMEKSYFDLLPKYSITGFLLFLIIFIISNCRIKYLQKHGKLIQFYKSLKQRK